MEGNFKLDYSNSSEIETTGLDEKTKKYKEWYHNAQRVLKKTKEELKAREDENLSEEFEQFLDRLAKKAGEKIKRQDFPFKKHLKASAIPLAAIAGSATLLFASIGGIAYHLYHNQQSLSEQMQKFVTSIAINYEKYIIAAAAITVSVVIITGVANLAIEYAKHTETLELNSNR